jgi:hypothetical protein
MEAKLLTTLTSLLPEYKHQSSSNLNQLSKFFNSTLNLYIIIFSSTTSQVRALKKDSELDTRYKGAAACSSLARESKFSFRDEAAFFFLKG